MREDQIKLSLFYYSRVAVVARLLFAGLLLFLIVLGIYNPSLFFLSTLIILEIFFKFKVSQYKPAHKLNEKSEDLSSFFTKEALEAVVGKKDSQDSLKYLLKYPQNRFILRKSAIGANEIGKQSPPLDQLAQNAYQLALKTNGKHVTSSDLLVSYFLLTEPATKLLFNKQLKEQDLIRINQWARVIYQEEEIRKRKVRYQGVGIGETLVWGWTPETKKYTRDHTFSNTRRKSLIEGRETEYKTLLDTLLKHESNNVLLVGDVGTGKDNLADNFIFESYEGVLPKGLNHRRFLELMIGPFIAGATTRGDLETRLQMIIDEVKHSGNVVLYIPEFQNLLGASSFAIDLSGAILPYLKDGKMPIIATMTKGEYKKYFEGNPLKEVFEVITLDEPDKEEALKMLFRKTDEIEEQIDVYLSYRAVVSAVELADKYEVGAVLPGTAVDLLQDAANSVKIAKGKRSLVLEEDIEKKVEEKSKIPVGAPKKEEKKFLLNLENEMKKFIVGQEEAIIAISEAMRRIRTGLTRNKPISFLFLGPTGVGKTETAKTLARLYFGGEAKIIRVDMSEYGTQDSLQRMLKAESGSFLDEVLNHPFSLILLDEFEKADEKILNLFLQVFDDGRMTNDKGQTISFNNAIIISTSNAGSEFIRESVGKVKIDKTFNKSLLDQLQQKGIFKPELLNRYDEIVVFKPLDQEQIVQITKMVVDELVQKLSKQDIALEVEDAAITKLATDSFDQEFGARPIRRYVEDHVEDMISKKMLSDEIKRGDKIILNLDSSGNLLIA